MLQNVLWTKNQQKLQPLKFKQDPYEKTIMDAFLQKYKFDDERFGIKAKIELEYIELPFLLRQDEDALIDIATELTTSKTQMRRFVDSVKQEQKALNMHYIITTVCFQTTDDIFYIL